jgi:hypothetical protein
MKPSSASHPQTPGNVLADLPGTCRLFYWVREVCLCGFCFFFKAEAEAEAEADLKSKSRFKKKKSKAKGDCYD